MEYEEFTLSELGQQMALFQIEADNIKELHDNSTGQYISVNEGEFVPAQQHYMMKALLTYTEMAKLQKEINLRVENTSGNRISRSQYEEFLVDTLRVYYTTKERSRLGQMFLHRFWAVLKLPVPDAELYNEADVSKCIDLIREKYVNL